MAQTAPSPVGLVRPGPNFNPSPKTRFRESADNISRHRALIEQREFDRALDFALLEYQLQTAANVKDANGALAMGYKLLGVQEFIATLKLLSEVPRPIGEAIHQNLDHRS